MFYDENAIRFSDPDDSEDEDRFLILGLSFALNIVVVCHCYRASVEVVRLISARKANRREQAAYRG